MRTPRAKILATSVAAAAVLAVSGAQGASADVAYSDAYWAALDSYAGFEFKQGDWAWSGRRGVYEHDPRYAPWEGVWTDTIEFVYLAPDGTLGYRDWIEDPSDEDGWSYAVSDDFEG